MEALREAFRSQFHAAMAMLAKGIEGCPDDLWNDPSPEIDDGDRMMYRPYWRIAMHAAYFTHLYSGQSVDEFQPPEGLAVAARPDMAGLWDKSWNLEPFELPKDAPPVSKADLLEYVRFVDRGLDATMARLDFSASSSGIPWYPRHNKLAHELLTLRHLQGHVGQMSELLLARGLDIDWVSHSEGIPSPELA